MSSEKRRNTPAWRQDARAQQRDARGGWRQRPTADRKKRSRRTKIVLGVSALLACNIVLLFAVYWMWPPKPACLLLVGAGYEDNLAVPHNVYGWQGLNDLAEFSQSGSLVPSKWSSAPLRLKEPPVRLEVGADWTRLVEDFAEPTLVMFLSLHGGADADGPYLLPEGGNYTKECRIRITDVIDVFKSMPARKNKVLILDASHMEYHVRLGMLLNDFGRRLSELREQIEKVPNLVVLSASDADQRSWPCEAWGCTVFSRYVLLGLRGAADAPPHGDGNGRVDALELHKYVFDHVEQWTQKHRQARQTPVLLGSKDLASSIDLIVLKEPFSATDPQGAAGVERSSELSEIWQEYARLQPLAPRLRAIIPHLWKQYEELTIRREELVRAGSRNGSSELKQAVARLSADIAKAQEWELQSLDNSLAMPKALGSPMPLTRQAADLLAQDLLAATSESAGQRWREESGKVRSPMHQRLLRLQIGQRLLERTPSQALQHIAASVRLLPTLGFSVNQTPTELHWLTLLQRDLDAQRPPPDELLRKCLAISQLAQRAGMAAPYEDSAPAAYSEQVYPWTQAIIARADEQRRRGEDRMFATGASAWKLAAQDLDGADKDYQEALRRAEIARQACFVRDAALAELPGLASWLDARPEAAETDLKRLSDLWRSTDRLAEMLEPHAVQTDSFNQVETQARELRRELERFRSEFDKHCHGLGSKETPTVRNWRELEAALLVPWILPDVRARLIRQADALARAAPQIEPDEQGAGAAEAAAERALTTARRHGRLALTRLEQDPTLDAQLLDGRNDDAARTRLRVLGEAIASRYRRLPTDIEGAYADARRGDAKHCLAMIARAERLARCLEGGAERLASEHPADVARRVRWHELLAWQAERTHLDHWFSSSIEPGAEPYYVSSQGRFLHDARMLLQGIRGTALAEALQAKLVGNLQQKDRGGRLTVSGPDRLEVTSELRMPVGFGLQCDGWVPAGYPTVWLETEGGWHSSGERKSLEVSSQRPEMHAEFQVSAPAATKQSEPSTAPASIKLRGVYRGQRLEKVTQVYQQRTPEITARHIAPPRSGIAVRATPELFDRYASEPGQLAVVLDCTGSMLQSELVGAGRPYEDYDDLRAAYDAKTPCAYHEATEALDRLLRSIPSSTTVSVFVYGHRRRDAAQPPRNSQDPTEILRTPGPWDEAQRAKLVEQLRLLEPFHDESTYGAMLRSKRDGFSPTRRGPKTTVVFTDGEGSSFQEDRKLNAQGRTTIRDFIQNEFAAQGIVVHFVDYKIRKDPRPRFQAQLEKAIDHLELGTERLPLDRVDDLAASLSRRLRREWRFQVEREIGGSVPETPKAGWLVSTSLLGEHWGALPAGTYQVRLQTERPLTQRVVLDAGDRLMLCPSADGQHLERALIGGDKSGAARTVEKSGWHLSLLTPSSTAERGASWRVALEQQALPASSAQTLQQSRPRHVWFEPTSAPSSRQPAWEWLNLPAYPLSVWSLRPISADGAPGGSKPAQFENTSSVLRVWWSLGADYQPLRVPRSPGVPLEAAFTGEYPAGRESTGKVTVEGVALEDHDLEVAPGARQTRSCLVVRLRYPSQAPVWVELDGIQCAGQEHRWYGAANKYAGLFWDVSKDRAAIALTALKIYSVEEWKRQAHSAELRLGGSASAQAPQ